MYFSQPQILKRTGLKVGRLGLGAGYGAPANAYEEAFEKGCNYFYWLSRTGEPPLSATDCYRFALSNPFVDLCLCGPKDTEQMREALRSLDIGPMDKSELIRVRKIGDYVRSKATKFF